MAVLTSLESLLDYRTLTPAYQQYGRQFAGPNPLYDFYTKVPTQNFPTDEIEFITLSAVKDPAPTNFRGQPARKLSPTGKGRRRLAMLNAFNTLTLGMSSMQMLRKPDVWELQSRGEIEISQQMEDMARKHQVLKYLWVGKSLTGSAIYIDANGDILESSSGAVVTVETGVPAANQTQVAETNFGMGAGNIIDAAWDVAGTKILTQLDRLNEATEYQNSEPLRHIWLHASNKAWIRQNTEILAMYAAGQERLDNALRGDTFEINNYTFHFYNGTYEDSSGATAYYVPKTKAIITPEPGPWIAQGSGLQLVPTNLNITLGSGGALPTFGDWEEAYGDFAYVLTDHNPPSVHLYMGFNWLFGFKNPASVFVPTVDF